LVELVRKYWAQMSAMAADDASRLLGRPDTSEPYTILIMIVALNKNCHIITHSERPEDYSWFDYVCGRTNTNCGFVH
jgi:hypothetical protein